MQAGMVLVICLVFMLILAVIASQALQSATLQERMAGNAKDVDLALQAAEAALREAEALLQTVPASAFDGSEGRFLSCPDPEDAQPACDSPDWRDDNSRGWLQMSSFTAHGGRPPEFIVEQMAAVPATRAVLDADRPQPGGRFFRVTARGFGLSERSMVVLSSVYRREE